MDGLKELSISQNMISRFPNNIFADLVSLQYLDISNNPLKRLPRILPDVDDMVLSGALDNLAAEDLHLLAIKYHHNRKLLAEITQHENLDDKTKAMIRLVQN